MKIQIASDLHAEFQQDRGVSVIQNMVADENDLPDVLVLAGDCVTRRSGFNLLQEACDRFPRVVFVAGNHEFYRSSPKEVYEALDKFQSYNPNFHFLDNTDRLERLMNDFSVINADREWFYNQGILCRTFLNNNVQEGDIVITHHLPSYTCIHPKWFGEASNCFYANHLDQLIKDKKPAMWIHGHSHEQLDFMLHNTRMIRNPYGYRGELCNAAFRWDFTVEV